jgi:hypothetical protein
VALILMAVLQFIMALVIKRLVISSGTDENFIGYMAYDTKIRSRFTGRINRNLIVFLSNSAEMIVAAITIVNASSRIFSPGAYAI